MIEKEIKSRIIHKHDTEENWLKAVNFIPKQGELIIYDIDSIHTIERFKIGDGTTLVNDLPFQEVKVKNLHDGTGLKSLEQELDTTTWSCANKVAKEYIKNNTGTADDDWKIQTDTSGKVLVGAYGKLSTMMNGKSQTVGGKAHAEGSKTIAFENNSHAEGNETFAGGKHSHAEGSKTAVTGNAGHAEGIETQALGNGSHAEGYKTKVIGEYGHTEGTHTTAGDYAHAEGFSSKAKEKAAHAEGKETEANGTAAHAEGYMTKASGNYAHSEGKYYEKDGVITQVEASGEAAHAEGLGTIASSAGAHAEGELSKATGYASHAEGHSTAANSFAHAEGTAKATKPYAHAEGAGTQANANYSHSEGWGTIANGEAQHVQGKYNKEDATSAFIIGNGTSSARSNAMSVDWSGNVKIAGTFTDGDGNSFATILKKIGDIETALKTILSIQEQIVPQYMTFKAGNKTYTCLKGMTWGDLENYDNGSIWSELNLSRYVGGEVSVIIYDESGQYTFQIDTIQYSSDGNIIKGRPLITDQILSAEEGYYSCEFWDM